MKTFTTALQAAMSVGYTGTPQLQSSLMGRSFQKTLNSQLVVGPAVTGFIDTQTIAGVSPSIPFYDYMNNRLYILSATAIAPSVALFNFNSLTGAYSYVGKVILNLPNAAVTTYVFRGFKITNVSAQINIVLSATASIPVNGGTYIGYGLALTDFTPGGTTLYPANTSNQKAIYFLQDFSQAGGSHVATTSWGCAAPFNALTTAFKTRIIQLNNTVLVPQLFAWDLALGNPSVAGTVTNGVSANTAPYITVPSSTYFQMAALNGYNPTFGDQVCLMPGTGLVPNAFTGWAAATLQVAASNFYFMRDLVTINTFTVTVANATLAATYTTSNGVVVAVAATIAGATTLTASAGSNAFPSSGVLTKTGGTGDATITYSAASNGNWFFNLSVNTGGAALLPTSSSVNFTMLRAFGISTNLFYGKAMGFQALVGTLVQSNTIGAFVPTAAPLNAALNGQDCLSLSTQTTMYLGKISELFNVTTGTCSAYSNQLTVGSVSGLAAGQAISSTGFAAGVTILSIAGLVLTMSAPSITALAGASVSFGVINWASLTGANILGTGLDIVVPALAFSCYSNELDQFVYQDLTATFVVKKLQNNGALTAVFGEQAPTYMEGLFQVSTQLGGTAVTGIDVKNGWLFVANNAIGQRGIIFLDLYSDQLFGFTSTITKVQSVQAGSVFKYINALKQLFVQTDGIVYSIRNGTTAADVAFSTATSGTWIPITTATDLSAVAIGPFFQIRAQYYIVSGGLSTIPAQINEIVYTVQLPGESSDNWVMDNDSTSQNQVSPNYAGFYLLTAYASVVPTLFHRVSDLSGNIIFSVNSVTNAASFQYSTDLGVTWNALGTIPNTVGTKIRVLVTPTPSVTALTSIRES